MSYALERSNKIGNGQYSLNLATGSSGTLAFQYNGGNGLSKSVDGDTAGMNNSLRSSNFLKIKKCAGDVRTTLNEFWPNGFYLLSEIRSKVIC